jgi:hypothetical protein
MDLEQIFIDSILLTIIQPSLQGTSLLARSEKRCIVVYHCSSKQYCSFDFDFFLDEKKCKRVIVWTFNSVTHNFELEKCIDTGCGNGILSVNEPELANGIYDGDDVLFFSADKLKTLYRDFLLFFG